MRRQRRVPPLCPRHRMRQGQLRGNRARATEDLRRGGRLPGYRPRQLRPLRVQPGHERLLHLVPDRRRVLAQKVQEQLVLLRLMRLSMRGRLVLLLALATIETTATVEAAPSKRPAARPSVTPEQKQERLARTKFESAEKAFNLRRFDDALADYQAAYEALPLPAFLFNIAQCHRNLGNHEQAVFFYQRYLSLSPDAPNRTVVQELIAEQQRLTTRQVQAQGDVEPEPTPEREAAPAKAPVVIVPRASEPPAGGLESTRETRDTTSSLAPTRSSRRWWVIGVLGAAVLGGAALLVVRSSGSPPSGSLGSIDAR